MKKIILISMIISFTTATECAAMFKKHRKTSKSITQVEGFNRAPKNTGAKKSAYRHSTSFESMPPNEKAMAILGIDSSDNQLISSSLRSRSDSELQGFKNTYLNENGHVISLAQIFKLFTEEQKRSTEAYRNLHDFEYDHLNRIRSEKGKLMRRQLVRFITNRLNILQKSKLNAIELMLDVINSYSEYDSESFEEYLTQIDHLANIIQLSMCTSNDTLHSTLRSLKSENLALAFDNMNQNQGEFIAYLWNNAVLNTNNQADSDKRFLKAKECLLFLVDKACDLQLNCSKCIALVPKIKLRFSATESATFFCLSWLLNECKTYLSLESIEILNSYIPSCFSDQGEIEYMGKEIFIRMMGKLNKKHPLIHDLVQIIISNNLSTGGLIVSLDSQAL